MAWDTLAIELTFGLYLLMPLTGLPLGTRWVAQARDLRKEKFPHECFLSPYFSVSHPSLSLSCPVEALALALPAEGRAFCRYKYLRL